MRYRLQRHDGTDCSATMVPFTVLRMVPIQRYRQFLFVRALQNTVMLMVKPRFAVAGPAVAGCGLSGPHMQALRPATAKRSFTPYKGIKSMRESGVFNGLFSDYSRLFQGWTRGINLKTRGDCLLSVCFDAYFVEPER